MNNIPNGNFLQVINSAKERSIGGMSDSRVMRELYTIKKMRLCYRLQGRITEHCYAHRPPSGDQKIRPVTVDQVAALPLGSLSPVLICVQLDDIVLMFDILPVKDDCLSA
jgi:hypothetical protein